MRITTTTPVDVPAEQAWAIVADEFGDNANWVSTLKSSRLNRVTVEIGTARVCQLGTRELVEEITELDRDRLVLTYKMPNPPGPVRTVTNTWTVTPGGTSRCEVTSDVHLSLHWWATPMAPLMRLNLNRVIGKALEEFRHYAETGTPHPRKMKQQSKLPSTRAATIQVRES